MHSLTSEQRSQTDVRLIEDAEIELRSRVDSKWRRAIGLLKFGQRNALLMPTGARAAVSFCDLAIATAMYLLFLLLQGNAPDRCSLRRAASQKIAAGEYR
jgi:hypothetical protein